MKLSMRSLLLLLILSVFAITASLGCSGNGDSSANDTTPKPPTSDTGQHSPPPMMHKSGAMQPGGGAPNSGKAMDQ